MSTFYIDWNRDTSNDINNEKTAPKNTYLKENVWYAYNSRYVFNYDSSSDDPALTKLTPNVGDSFYLVNGTASSTSTTYTFSSYSLWGTVTEVLNNGDRIKCKRTSDNTEYIFVRMKYDGDLRAWYNSSGNQRVYTQTTDPVELEGFYNENGVVYEGYDFAVSDGTDEATACKITTVTSEKIVISGSEPA